MSDIQYFRTLVIVDESQPDIPKNYVVRVVLAKHYDAALSREDALRVELATIYSDRDAEKEMKAKARDQRDVQTIRACELQQRLTVAEQRVQRMVDCSKGQDSIATGYLSDILALLKPAAKAESARDQGIPGTSFQRLNQLANEGE